MKNKADDMIGKKFGLLTVIERTDNYIFPNGDSVIAYNCRCDCGNSKVIPKRSLKNGNTKSCGCIHTEMVRKLGKSNIKKNTYDLDGEYGVGYTTEGKVFYFDKEDCNLIKYYYWNVFKGYVVSETNKQDVKTRMHRLIMNCVDKNLDVDHINHTSGVTGVTFNKNANKWAVAIQKDNKRIHLGVFDNFDEAVKVRKEAEIKYFGDYRYKEICQ